MADLDTPPRRILLLVTGGGYTHAAPVLELGSVLSSRGHEIHFATNTSQTHWAPSYIALTHDVGPAIPSSEADAHYARMRDWHPRDGMDAMLQSKRLFDSLWPDTYRHLMTLCLDPDNRPDFIIADFFSDSAARDMLKQLNIPIAVVWPQMPYLMAPASYMPGQPGFQVETTLTSEHASLSSRIRNELVLFRALPALLSWLRWTKQMRSANNVHYTLPHASQPDYLVLVNSFFGLEVPKDLPPLIHPIGPILSDHYPSLTPDLSSFLATHSRTLYVSLGTHVHLPSQDLHRLLSALLSSLDSDLINGIIWSIPKRAISSFDPSATYPRSDGSSTSASSILSDLDPQILILPFAPQRAILDHPNTVLFLTHGGGSSANETLYHGCPILAIGYFFDQLCNSARLSAAGVGLSLEKSTFTTSAVESAISTILNDDTGSFSQNVLRMRRIARIAAKRGKYRAADLVEEVMYDHELRFDYQGAELRPMHLQTAEARMSKWRSRNWDIWALGLTSVGIIGFATWSAATWWSVSGIKHFRQAILYSRNLIQPLISYTQDVIQPLAISFKDTLSPIAASFQDSLQPVAIYSRDVFQLAALQSKNIMHAVAVLLMQQKVRFMGAGGDGS